MGVEYKCSNRDFPPNIQEELERLRQQFPGQFIIPPGDKEPPEDQPNDLWIPPPGKEQPDREIYSGLNSGSREKLYR